jgi:hypothetical protein
MAQFKSDKRILETLEWFDHVKRGEDTITVLKEGAPEALRDAIHEAHGDRLPDDWIYDKFEEILYRLSEYEIDNMDKFEEYRHEIVDVLVDIYNTDLTAWMAASIDNVAEIDEAVAELGAPDGVIKSIQYGQYKLLDEIYSVIINYIEKL